MFVQLEGQTERGSKNKTYFWTACSDCWGISRRAFSHSEQKKKSMVVPCERSHMRGNLYAEKLLLLLKKDISTHLQVKF